MGVCGDSPKASSLTSVGTVQLSVDGTTWAASFDAVPLVASSAVDFYVRVDPASLEDADDGSYEYDFLMTGAAGGLSLVNTAQNMAHITGTTPADQAGKTLTINCTVIDKAGTSLDATPLSGDWGDPTLTEA